MHPLIFRNQYIKDFSENLSNEVFESTGSLEKLPVKWNEMRVDQEFSVILSQLLEYRVFQLYFYNLQVTSIDEIIHLIELEMR